MDGTGLGTTTGGGSSEDTALVAPRLWDAGTGELIAVLGEAIDPGRLPIEVRERATSPTIAAVERGRRETFATAAFSPDGRRVVTAGHTEYLNLPLTDYRLWDAGDGARVEPSSSESAGAPRESQVVVEADRRLHIIPRHPTDFSDATHLLVWQADADGGRWSRSPSLPETLDETRWRSETLPQPLCALADPPWVVTTDGAAVTVERIDGGSTRLELLGHDEPVTAAAFIDRDSLLTASMDGTLRVWSLAGSGIPLTLADPRVTSLGFARYLPDGQRIVTAPAGDRYSMFADGPVGLWETKTGTLVRTPMEDWIASTPELHRQLLGNLEDLDTSPDGTRLATVTRDDNPFRADEQSTEPLPEYAPVKVWDLRNGRLLFQLDGLTRSATMARFSPDGDRILTFAEGNDRIARIRDGIKVGSSSGGQLAPRVDVWDGHTGAHLANLAPEEPGGGSFALWRPDGETIVTNIRYHPDHVAADVLDAVTGRRVSRLEGTGTGIDRAAVSPDGRLVLGYRRNINRHQSIVPVWDAESGARRWELSGHTGDVTSACFSSDSRAALTTSTDGTARVWDMATGDERRVLAGHGRPVRAGAFSPDRTWIATGGADGTLRLWDADSGALWMTIDLPGTEVVAVAFSPDSRQVLSVSTDNVARLWPVDPLDDAVAQMPRTLTGAERSRYGIDDPAPEVGLARD